MTDKLSGPTLEELTSVKFKELVALFDSKGVAVPCKECGKKDQQVNLATNSGQKYKNADEAALVVTQDSVLNESEINIAYQYYTVVCTNCYSTRFFNAIGIYKEIAAQRESKNAN